MTPSTSFYIFGFSLPLINAVVTVIAVFLLTTSSNEATGILVLSSRRAAKYVVAVFIATLGSLAIAVALASPLLLYGHMFHSSRTSNMFGTLLDRPLFPLQIATAAILGYLAFRLSSQKFLKYIWIVPSLGLLAAVMSWEHSTAFQNSLKDLEHLFFNWGCACPASLLQWHVCLPAYTGMAFSVGSTVCGTQKLKGATS